MSPNEEAVPPPLSVPSGRFSFRPSCRICGRDDFPNGTELSRHEKRHDRPWKCPNVDCDYHIEGFPNHNELFRHTSQVHDKVALFTCPVSSCGHKTARKSNLFVHMENKHGIPYLRSTSRRRRPANTTASSSGGSNDAVIGTTRHSWSFEQSKLFQSRRSTSLLPPSHRWQEPASPPVMAASKLSLSASSTQLAHGGAVVKPQYYDIYPGNNTPYPLEIEIDHRLDKSKGYIPRMFEPGNAARRSLEVFGAGGSISGAPHLATHPSAVESAAGHGHHEAMFHGTESEQYDTPSASTLLSRTPTSSTRGRSSSRLSMPRMKSKTSSQILKSDVEEISTNERERNISVDHVAADEMNQYVQSPTLSPRAIMARWEAPPLEQERERGREQEQEKPLNPVLDRNANLEKDSEQMREDLAKELLLEQMQKHGGVLEALQKFGIPIPKEIAPAKSQS